MHELSSKPSRVLCGAVTALNRATAAQSGTLSEPGRRQATSKAAASRTPTTGGLCAARVVGRQHSMDEPNANRPDTLQLERLLSEEHALCSKEHEATRRIGRTARLAPARQGFTSMCSLGPERKVPTALRLRAASRRQREVGHCRPLADLGRPDSGAAKPSFERRRKRSTGR